MRKEVSFCRGENVSNGEAEMRGEGEREGNVKIRCNHTCVLSKFLACIYVYMQLIPTVT